MLVSRKTQQTMSRLDRVIRSYDELGKKNIFEKFPNEGTGQEKLDFIIATLISPEFELRVIHMAFVIADYLAVVEAIEEAKKKKNTTQEMGLLSDLPKFLITPIQRFPRIQLLIKELNKNYKPEKDKEDLSPKLSKLQNNLESMGILLNDRNLDKSDTTQSFLNNCMPSEQQKAKPKFFRYAVNKIKIFLAKIGEDILQDRALSLFESKEENKPMAASEENLQNSSHNQSNPPDSPQLHRSDSYHHFKNIEDENDSSTWKKITIAGGVVLFVVGAGGFVVSFFFAPGVGHAVSLAAMKIGFTTAFGVKTGTEVTLGIGTFLSGTSLAAAWVGGRCTLQKLNFFSSNKVMSRNAHSDEKKSCWPSPFACFS